MKDLNEKKVQNLNEFSIFPSFWLNWQPWSPHCDRNCSQKYGTKFRERECFSCSLHQCFKVGNRQCSNNTSQSREFQFCYQGLLIKC